MTSVLQADGITLRFGGVTAIDDVSFSVAANALVALIGLYAKLYTMQFSRDGYATEVVDRWPISDRAYEFEFGTIPTSDIS